MPVLRLVEDTDRWGQVTKRYMIEVDPDEEQDFHEEAMRYGIHSDNSDYNLAAETKAKRRKRLERLMKK